MSGVPPNLGPVVAAAAPRPQEQASGQKDASQPLTVRCAILPDRAGVVLARRQALELESGIHLGRDVGVGVRANSKLPVRPLSPAEDGRVAAADGAGVVGAAGDLAEFYGGADQGRHAGGGGGAGAELPSIVALQNRGCGVEQESSLKSGSSTPRPHCTVSLRSIRNTQEALLTPEQYATPSA